MMNLIIFSKDRACQMELLLRSMKKRWPESFDYGIKILYKNSNVDFERGYNKLILEYDNVDWIKETNFKENLISMIDIKKLLTIFFVDDQVFKEDFSSIEIYPFLKSNDILCLSLRLHPNLIYCYAANVPMRKINNTIFDWRNKDGDYNYPMSLDSHIFFTKDIYPYVTDLKYNNPNQLESMMSYNPINKPKMMCFNKSKTINNPCNKVQINNPNKHGNISAEYLNKEYLNGKIIDLSTFDGLMNESCHKEIPIKLIKK